MNLHMATVLGLEDCLVGENSHCGVGFGFLVVVRDGHPHTDLLENDVVCHKRIADLNLNFARRDLDLGFGSLETYELDGENQSFCG